MYIIIYNLQIFHSALASLVEATYPPSSSLHVLMTYHCRKATQFPFITTQPASVMFCPCFLPKHGADMTPLLSS